MNKKLLAAVGGGLIGLFLWKRLIAASDTTESWPGPSQTGAPAKQSGRKGGHPSGSFSGERRAEPDPQALAESRRRQDRIGFDLERLKDKSTEFKPLVEHLSYIQVKRGEKESLIFVRRRDLETLAALTGLSEESFVEQFQDMGVLVSMN